LYKCGSNGGGVLEASSEENTRSFNYLKKGVPSITITSDEEMEEEMKNVLCMKRMEWCGRKCELVNHVGDIIVEGRIIAHDPREPILDEDFGEIKVGSQFRIIQRIDYK
jgi:hypothetical protein